jgi:biotin carboxylase
MASPLTGENAVDTYTQNQARLARAQRLLDAAHPLIGIRSEKTRLDRLLALAGRILRRTR